MPRRDAAATGGGGYARPMHQTRRARFATPIGTLELLSHAGPWDEGGGRRLARVSLDPSPGAGGEVGGPDADGPACPVLERATVELAEYFAGVRRSFGVALALGGTSFQRRVWEGLIGIPYGRTTSYGGLARALGLPAGAARAVGAACAANPLAVLLPCHRVVAADGSITGYAWGTHRKRWLLEHEAAHRPRDTATQWQGHQRSTIPLPQEVG